MWRVACSENWTSLSRWPVGSCGGGGRGRKGRRGRGERGTREGKGGREEVAFHSPQPEDELSTQLRLTWRYFSFPFKSESRSSKIIRDRKTRMKYTIPNFCLPNRCITKIGYHCTHVQSPPTGFIPYIQRRLKVEESSSHSATRSLLIPYLRPSPYLGEGVGVLDMNLDRGEGEGSLDCLSPWTYIPTMWILLPCPRENAQIGNPVHDWTRHCVLICQPEICWL